MHKSMLSDTKKLWLLYPKSSVLARPISDEYERRRVVVLNEIQWGLSYDAYGDDVKRMQIYTQNIA